MPAQRILLVEDNELNMELATDLLEAAGFEVIRATSGEEAIALFPRVQPDLVLMDIQMPGVDGLTATRVLKSQEHAASVPIVALTARAMAGEMEMILRAGCDGYISKPIDTREFVQQVRKALANGPKPSADGGEAAS